MQKFRYNPLDSQNNDKQCVFCHKYSSSLVHWAQHPHQLHGNLVGCENGKFEVFLVTGVSSCLSLHLTCLLMQNGGPSCFFTPWNAEAKPPRENLTTVFLQIKSDFLQLLKAASIGVVPLCLSQDIYHTLPVEAKTLWKCPLTIHSSPTQA